MPDDSSSKSNETRAGILTAVTNRLRLFALVLLVAEGSLGAVALATSGTNQLIAMGSMLIVLVGLVFVVARKPDSFTGSDDPEGERLLSFCKQIEGYWWEFVSPNEPSAISYVHIEVDRPNAR
jgi:hypothetical protein